MEAKVDGTGGNAERSGARIDGSGPTMYTESGLARGTSTPVPPSPDAPVT